MLVGFFFDLGELELGISRVHHDLSLMPSVYYEAQNVFGVSKAAASQQEILTAQRYSFLAIRKEEGALEFVNKVISFFADKPGSEFFNRIFTCEQTVEGFLGFLVLQVGFSVEVLGLNIADTFRLGAFEENQISWEELIAHHLNDLAHF